MATLVEFLDPLKKGKRKEQVLAALYFIQVIDQGGEASTSEIREALVRGKVPQAKKINVTDALNKGPPLVDRVGPYTRWRLTDTGVKYIEDLLVIPDDTPQVQHDVAELERLAATITDANVRDYIEEGIKCLKVGALRAAVVFIWTGAIETVRNAAWTFGPTSIDAAIRKHDKRARDFIKKDDFENVKDSALLQIAHDFGIYDKSEKKRLKEALDLRNDCGHPVKYKPGKNKVAGFIEDIVGTVFS